MCGDTLIYYSCVHNSHFNFIVQSRPLHTIKARYFYLRMTFAEQKCVPTMERIPGKQDSNIPRKHTTFDGTFIKRLKYLIKITRLDSCQQVRNIIFKIQFVLSLDN
jgi:hypothetical protein